MIRESLLRRDSRYARYVRAHMKKFKNILIIAIFTLIGASCSQSYKLKEGDLNYIPYEGNEILVFKSDQNRMDTIFLKGISDFNGCGDPLAIFPDKCQGKSLNCTRTDPNYDRYLEGKQLVELVASSRSETYISFDIVLKGSWFYNASESLSLHQFDSIPNKNLKIENKTYSDVKIFEATQYAKQYEDRKNYAVRFYWSENEGFLGLDRRDEKWRLIKKYVP